MGKERIDGLMVLLQTLPGISFVYNGDEIGMEDHTEISWEDTQDIMVGRMKGINYYDNFYDYFRRLVMLMLMRIELFRETLQERLSNGIHRQMLVFQRPPSPGFPSIHHTQPTIFNRKRVRRKVIINFLKNFSSSERTRHSLMAISNRRHSQLMSLGIRDLMRAFHLSLPLILAMVMKKSMSADLM